MNNLQTLLAKAIKGWYFHSEENSYGGFCGYNDEYFVQMVCEELDITEEDYKEIMFSEPGEKEIWITVSNNSECDDLSLYKFYGTKKDSYKKMQAMALETALNTDPDKYFTVNMNSSDMTANIQWADSHEDFRIVSFADTPLLDNADGVIDVKDLDALPDDFYWNNEEAHEILFPFHDLDEFEVELFATDETITGYFSNGRMDRNKLPNGWFAYDLCEGESGEFCTLEPVVHVNHGGTFVTKKSIEFGEKGFLELETDFEYLFC